MTCIAHVFCVCIEFSENSTYLLENGSECYVKTCVRESKLCRNTDMVEFTGHQADMLLGTFTLPELIRKKYRHRHGKKLMNRLLEVVSTRSQLGEVRPALNANTVLRNEKFILCVGRIATSHCWEIYHTR